MGLSFPLQGLLNATPVQAFAAGAALCSTSLGTTFTVLTSSGLSSSRLGVVLTSAAMMDDVVGLVMVQVISNLGGVNFSWIVVVRPVLVSIAFAVFVPIFCLLVLKPVTLRMNGYREAHPTGGLDRLFRRSQTAFALHTALLIGLITGATYAGTSNLFAAYVAGAIISWWDSDLPHPDTDRATQAVSAPERKHPISTEDSACVSHRNPGLGGVEDPVQTSPTTRLKDKDSQVPETDSSHSPISSNDSEDTSGPAIYHRYYHHAVSKMLQPIFFASIGFSIPITRMFRGAIVWRGVVYTSLMAFGKLVCGLWLVRFSMPPRMERLSRLVNKLKSRSMPHAWGRSEGASEPTQAPLENSAHASPSDTANSESHSSPDPARPFSLHPPLILGLAMCARGEIGFLISGVAESKGVFSSTNDASGDSDIFLVVTWAIMLCTFAGPLGVGLSVRRVRKLQGRKNREQDGSGKDVLGVWGVE